MTYLPGKGARQILIALNGLFLRQAQPGEDHEGAEHDEIADQRSMADRRLSVGALKRATDPGAASLQVQANAGCVGTNAG